MCSRWHWPVLIAFMKGAFGGGFAIIGIRCSLAMDPIAAGAPARAAVRRHGSHRAAVLAPIHGRVDLAVLLPALVVGVGLGYFVLRDL